MSQKTTGDAPARVDADNAAVHVDDASARSPGTARRSRCWAVVPAAGVGTRVGAAVPKQYLDLAGRSVLEWSLAPLLAADWIERVVLVLAPDDARAGALSARHPRLQVRAVGGAERRDSVLAGIESLAAIAQPDDWILVHDAARPCLSAAQLEGLIEQVGSDATGGILAVPVADTLKRATPDRRIEATVPREHLWQAQTPQMFRYGLLREALSRNPAVTGEAAAVEALGIRAVTTATVMHGLEDRVALARFVLDFADTLRRG